MAYPPPISVVRSLSPITELTTPASARSIPLPSDRTYDYQDESPIHPRTSGSLGRPEGEDEDDEGDRDSSYSHESNRTVVPSPAEPSPLPGSDSSSPLPSPPSTIRAFSSPATGLPPPPPPIHSRADNHSQPTTPRSSALQLEPQAIRELKIFLGDVGNDSPDAEEDDDEMDRASVSTAGMAGIGSGIYGDAVKQKKHRPKSLHVTSHRALSPITSALPSVHASLINIPNIPSLPPTPLARGSSLTPKASRKESPPSSRPSSPKSRPSTLKKRPFSLQTSRPTSWTNAKPSKTPKNTAKKSDKGKGKPRNRNLEIDGSVSSNDDQSDTVRSPPLVTRANTASPRKRIPSILLSLFDTSSARQSRTTSLVSLVTSPTGSDVPQSPGSPRSPSPNTVDERTGTAEQPTPQAAIRLSGTFGIRDDGSVHLLDDGLPPPRVSTSSIPGRPDRQRRDSDSGTVKSGHLGRVLYVNNRDSIDETEENEVRSRSFTPFEPHHPVSPLEAVLGDKPPEGKVGPERKSLEVQRELLLSPGRSDTSQRAQSPSTAQPSISTGHDGAPISRQSSHRFGKMVDASAQTSVPPSPVPSRRPLPRPPSNGTTPVRDSHNCGTASNSYHSNTGRDRTRPTSLPPPPFSFPYPQPQGIQNSSGQTPELPLLIASHLLSTHAASLMRQSAGLVEGAEMMKRMADESMQWGAMLLSMATSTSQTQSSAPLFPPPTATSRDREPVVSPMRTATTSATTDQAKEQSDDRHSIHIPASAASITFDPLYPSRPIFYPPPPPRPSARDRQKAESEEREREKEAENERKGAAARLKPVQSQSPSQLPYLNRNSGESDRYTRLPPRRERTSSLNHWASIPSPEGPAPQSPTDQSHPQSQFQIQSDKRYSTQRHENDHRHEKREVSVSSGFYEQVDNIGRKGFEELHKAEEVWMNGMRDLRSFLDTRPEIGSPSTENNGIHPSNDHHPPPQSASIDKHTQDTFHTAVDGSEESQSQIQNQGQKSKSRLSTPSAKRRSTSIRRALSTSTSSGVRSDESFLPQSADLGGPSTGTGTARTDESFLPQSADLMTPIDDSTIRPRPRIQTRPTLSPPPTSTMTGGSPPISADLRKGYDSSQIHTLLSDGFRPFDLPPPPPPFSRYQNDHRDRDRDRDRESKEYERYGNGPPSAISTGTAGRKLRKRASATSELRQPSSAGAGTVKSMGGKKRHWWSRRSRVSGSEDMPEPVTAY